MNKTAALVLETHNLEGGDTGSEQMLASLSKLFARFSEQTRQPDELVVTHRGWSEAKLARVAPKTARFVELSSNATYYDAKNAGFDATHSDIVAFADSDCWPASSWFEELLAPMSTSGVQAVAGRTTYRDDMWGRAATAIDFLYFDNPQDDGCTLNFYANNVAFLRATFAERRFPEGEAMYRGHCQMLGARLHEDGVPIRYAHSAHTVHRFPDGLRELLELRLLRGRDLTLLAPHLAAAYLPKAAPIASSPRLLSHLVFGARLAASLHNPGAAGLAAAATVCGISALDWLGSMGAGDRVFKQANAGGPVLSYHQNRDRLSDTLQAVQSI